MTPRGLDCGRARTARSGVGGSAVAPAGAMARRPHRGRRPSRRNPAALDPRSRGRARREPHHGRHGVRDARGRRPRGAARGQRHVRRRSRSGCARRPRNRTGVATVAARAPAGTAVPPRRRTRQDDPPRPDLVHRGRRPASIRGRRLLRHGPGGAPAAGHFGTGLRLVRPRPRAAADHRRSDPGQPGHPHVGRARAHHVRLAAGAVAREPVAAVTGRRGDRRATDLQLRARAVRRARGRPSLASPSTTTACASSSSSRPSNTARPGSSTPFRHSRIRAGRR